MGDADVEALERCYDALNRGDLSIVLDLLDPDIEWHEPGPSPEAGTHRGRDAFERFFRGWLESFQDFRVEPERVVQRGDRLVAVVRQSGRGGPAAFKSRRAWPMCGPSRTAGPFAGKRSRSPRPPWAMPASGPADLARHALEQVCSGSDPSAAVGRRPGAPSGWTARARGHRLGTQLPEGVTCDPSLWAACIGGAMQRDRYREAIEAAGLEITAWTENKEYRFVSERAENAVRKYGVTSISLLARRGGPGV